MENQPRCVLMFPLKEIALRRIAVAVWNEQGSLGSIMKFRFHSKIYHEYYSKWRETVECEVLDKMSKLQLPESLKKQLIHVLKPVGLHLLRWKKFHEAFLSQQENPFPNVEFDLPILKKLCWTSAGTVDYRKTAENLVRCEILDIVKRYKLACLYCMVHYIPEFWKQLPEENKMYFCSIKNIFLLSFPLRLVFCWPYFLKGEISKVERLLREESPTALYQFLVKHASTNGHKDAAEYFLQKLTGEEREAALITAVQSAVKFQDWFFVIYSSNFQTENVYELLCYLLSQMTTEQQIRVFKENIGSVLGCFLDWRLQYAFPDITDTLWTLMETLEEDKREENCGVLLKHILHRITYSGYYSPYIYQKFLLNSPSHFRKYFIDEECRCGILFAGFFNNEDMETINAILSSANAEDRMRLVSSEHLLKHFYTYILNGKGEMLEECLRDTGLSKEDKASLKEEFTGFLRNMDKEQINWESRNLKRFLEFLDECDAGVPSKIGRYDCD